MNGKHNDYFYPKNGCPGTAVYVPYTKMNLIGLFGIDGFKSSNHMMIFLKDINIDLIIKKKLFHFQLRKKLIW